MNIDIQALATRALAFGFTSAGPLDAATLCPREEVRGMCAADRCRHYGKSWTCPPACPSLEENKAELAKYKSGVLVQTTGTPEDEFDLEGMQEIGRAHMRRFHAFHRALREEYPGLLALGAGACDLCGTCTCPDAPCRRPGDAVTSMEAFGLVVSDACRDNGMKYNYGPGTMTFTGCFLVA
jgi:predicted metal-binding protein